MGKFIREHPFITYWMVSGAVYEICATLRDIFGKGEATKCE